MNSVQTNALYIDPIRNDNTVIPILYYDPITKEIVYSTKPTAPFPSGTNYGDYIYWDSVSTSWVIGSTKINLGSGAGQINQGGNSVALGNQSGNLNQGASSIAIGDSSGNINQGVYSIASGYQAGEKSQGNYAIAVGYQAGN